jgi:hypothetical protein
MSNDSDEYIITWEAPIIEKPEFRLYYGEKGEVVTYTCEKLDGDYIVIDTLTFAEARPDVQVMDGKIVRTSSAAVITRLYPSYKGTLCEREDISVIADSDGQYWDLKTFSP